MLGLVPVRVLGSIECGESLFASNNRPGIAVSENHQTFSPNEQTALVGHSIEQKESVYIEDEVP